MAAEERAEAAEEGNQAEVARIRRQMEDRIREAAQPEDGEQPGQRIADQAPPGEPAGTRYFGGRRLRTY
jgi:hypothetical protein